MSFLFTPGTIGSMQLKNRFVRSATVECLVSDDNHITDEYLRAYTRLAKGGAGLIIPGNFYVNAMGRAIPKVLVIDRDEVIEELQKVTQSVHEHGAKIVAQVNHGGRQCNPRTIGARPISPSRVKDKLNRIKPRQMSLEEIEETIKAYGDAARRVKDAGFDGVQIHAAHGYLINQFLSSYTNRRTDEWGGSLDNRMRFLLTVYEVIRDKVGPGYPVLIKINSEDYIKRGVTLEECIAVCQKLDELGIDAIEVSGGIMEQGFVATRGDIPKELLLSKLGFMKRMLFGFVEKKLRTLSQFEEGYFLPQAAAVKQNVGVPIIAVGGMRRRAMMEHVLESGQADFISLSRPFIRQPNLVKVMGKSAEKDPITCTNCNRCTIEIALHYKPLRCYYPRESREEPLESPQNQTV